MLERLKKPAKESSAPIVCDICGDEVAAQMKGKRLCLKHYEERKQEALDHVHAEMLEAIRRCPEWQPGAQETQKQYRRRMMAEMNEMLRMAKERMQRPLT